MLDWIKRLHNAIRLHSTNGYLSPVDFERAVGLANSVSVKPAAVHMNGPQASSPPGANARIGWVDTAKGLGIILVVVGHVLRSLVNSKLVTATPAVAYIDAWIYAFHMPLFFFLSGLFLSRSAARPLPEFVRDKIGTIAYPYFVWTLITLLIKSPMGPAVNQPRTLLEIPNILLVPIEQFWFLYVLFLLSVGAGLLLKIGIKPWAIVVLAALLFPGIWPFPWSGFIPFELAKFDAIYFALGIFLGQDKFARLPATAGAGTLAATAAVGFLVVTSFATFLDSTRPNPLDFVLAASGTAGAVSLAMLANRAAIDSAISFLGRYSLEIFVAHTIASAAIRILLQQVWHVTMTAPYVVLCTMAGLYGPVYAAIALKRIGFRWAFTMPKRNAPTSSMLKEGVGLQAKPGIDNPGRT